MKPIEVFTNGRERSEYLISLHELLCNRRRRGTRQDWARRFKRLMHWAQGEDINRIDGSHAVLVLRQGSALAAEHFGEERLNELLRGALAGTVSALDRYCHDLVVSRIVSALGKSEKEMNRELRQFRIPVIAAKKAIKHARTRRGNGGRVRPRPMNIIRHAVQDVLYRDETFQRPADIAKGLRLVGIEDLWEDCSARMNCRPGDITRRLDRVVDRRNRIVHEGDVLRRKRGGRLALHPLTRDEVRSDVAWVADLVNVIEAVVNQ